MFLSFLLLKHEKPKKPKKLILKESEVSRLFYASWLRPPLLNT